MDDTLIQVKNLQISFKYDGVMTPVIRGVSFDIKRGETLGMVGESGSGKSVTSREIMRLIATPPARIDSGEILFEGRDILKMSDDELRSIRGNRISMIFQEPMTSLNPRLHLRRSDHGGHPPAQGRQQEGGPADGHRDAPRSGRAVP